jgi:hypothetical protein
MALGAGVKPMASNRQIEANRGNAKQSTGPRTKAGKLRSSRNSLRHGLSRPISTDTYVKLRAMNHDGLGGSLDLAETRLELARIRLARGALIAAFLKHPHVKLSKTLRGIDRYEREAFSKQKRLLRNRGEFG